jgi:outer membrane lipopolysaccharide assembly protein LptE/RlpB
MKKTVATFCLLGATLSLSACNFDTTGNTDTAPPYSMDRTATYGDETSATAATPTSVAPAEKVFRRAQTK